MNDSDRRPLRVAVIGAGVRGTSLARKAADSDSPVQIIAVAEPDETRKLAFASEFCIGKDNIYSGWEDLCENLEACDAVIIATLDNQHSGPALAALDRGWHILIEKPLADSLHDCRLIAAKQKEKGEIVAVCHTLRFMEGYRRLRELAVNGNIGEIVHIEHMEAIGNLRYSHNYVRGRWAKESNNTFLLLHKCSHDIDYLNWLIPGRCTKVSSFGSLQYFTKANAPPGSMLRCSDGCGIAGSCQYSAVRLYVDSDLTAWPARDICSVHTKDAHLEAIKNGPFGKCVWHADNDVVDHQTVMMEFEGGATVTCTLTGYSATNGRRIRIQGTRGEILFDEAAGTITTMKFEVSNEIFEKLPSLQAYHPEDQDIVNEWISSILHSTSITVDAAEALRTLAVVFAAEISRKENRTVLMDELTEDI
jgi:predicted dehydrogenase